jgi:hypothetical protein
MKMKKNIKVVAFFVVLSVIISGCGTKGTGSESPTPTSTSSPTESSSPEPSETPKVTLLEQFKDMTLANGPADELFTSFKQMIMESEPAEADELIRTLESYYSTHLSETEKKFEPENVQKELSTAKWPFTEDQIAGIKDDSVRSLVEQTIAGGYKLEITEGYAFPVVDYGKLLSFGDRVTTPMKAYLDLMAMESDEKTASDGGIVISLEELSRRTLAAESYVVTFPDTVERKKAEDRFIKYLSFYLIGLNNTPIFDFETFIILPEVKSQFEQMVASHSGTVTGQLTKQMLDILKESGDAVFTKSKDGGQTDVPAVKAFRDQLESTARAKLAGGNK